MTTTTHDSPATPPSPPQDVTPRQALEAIQRLVPQLIAEQPETERRSTYSPELHEQFRQAGLYRLLQPRRYGGYAFELPSFLEVMRVAARGCMSAAWCLCLGAGHALQVGSWFPRETQDEVFCTGHAVIPMTSAPGGGAQRDPDGGWVLNTRHPYCSGSPYSTHYVGQALEMSPSGGPPVQPIMFIAPRDQYEVLDDWGATLGLKGSGSNTIVFEGGRLPERYVLEGKLQVEYDSTQGTPGYDLHRNPMNLAPGLAFFCLELATLTVGCALGALDEYEHLMRTRTSIGRPPLIPRVEDPDYRRWFGLATARLNAAQAIVDHTADRWMAVCQRAADGGEPFTHQDDVLLNMTAREAIVIGWTAVQDTIFRTAGSSAARNGERLERCFRDLAQCWGHLNTILQDFMARDWSTRHFAP